VKRVVAHGEVAKLTLRNIGVAVDVSHIVEVVEAPRPVARVRHGVRIGIVRPIVIGGVARVQVDEPGASPGALTKPDTGDRPRRTSTASTPSLEYVRQNLRRNLPKLELE